jgi:hypothetical protein
VPCQLDDGAIVTRDSSIQRVRLVDSARLCSSKRGAEGDIWPCSSTPTGLPRFPYTTLHMISHMHALHPFIQKENGR